MKKLVKTVISSALIAIGSAAGAATPEEIQAKYRGKFEELRKEGNALKNKEQPSAVGATVGIDCKTKMGLQTIKIPVPEVTMRLETFVFHILEMKMDETRFGPAVITVPQFKWGEQTVKMHWPEIKNGLMEIKMDLPEVTCGDVRASLESTKGQAKSLEGRAKQLGEQMKKELSDSMKGPLLEQKKQALSSIDGAIKGLEAMIAHARSAKGKVDDLVTKLQNLNGDRVKVIQQFDEALTKLGVTAK